MCPLAPRIGACARPPRAARSTRAPPPTPSALDVLWAACVHLMRDRNWSRGGGVMQRLRGLLLVGCLCSFVAVAHAQRTVEQGRARELPTRTVGSEVPPGYDRNFIEVKFLDDLNIGLGAEQSPIDR